MSEIKESCAFFGNMHQNKLVFFTVSSHHPRNDESENALKRTRAWFSFPSFFLLSSKFSFSSQTRTPFSMERRQILRKRSAELGFFFGRRNTRRSERELAVKHDARCSEASCTLLRGNHCGKTISFHSL